MAATPSTPDVEKKRECGDASAPPLAAASWGSQMDLLTVSQEGDILELDCGDDDDMVLNLLVSEEERMTSVVLARGCKDSSYCCIIGWG